VPGCLALTQRRHGNGCVDTEERQGADEWDAALAAERAELDSIRVVELVSSRKELS
jgi:hypothetical protein